MRDRYIKSEGERGGGDRWKERKRWKKRNDPCGDKLQYFDHASELKAFAVQSCSLPK